MLTDNKKKPDAVIVRLGELMLKGRNRHRFEKKIKTQLQANLSAFPAVRMLEEFGRIYLILNGTPYAPIAEGLSRIFGLSSYSPAYRVQADLESIRETGLLLISQADPRPRTFKVSVKRANKAFPHDSQELAYLVGGYILSRSEGLKVDVHQPETELRVDIRQSDVYLFTESVPGRGGFPAGSSGKAMAMLSGGIDSPVAAWYAMRKGLEIEAVHFHSYPYTSERAKQKVIDLARLLTQYTDRIHLHLVPFTDIQTRLNEANSENLMITLLRRSMFRITERLAEQRRAGAIVTGESLGQVASQTLPSLSAIGQVAGIPVLRPLIMMDKNEITEQAEVIGTYPISILPYEDCCTLFLPKSPSTNPNVRVLEAVEKGAAWLSQAEEEAVANTEMMTVRMGDQEEYDSFF